MRKMVKDMDISDRFIKGDRERGLRAKAIKNDSYSQMTLSKNGMTEKILEEMQRVADKDFIWMDAASFTAEVMVNYQNDSICTTSLRKIHESVRTDFRRQKPIGVRAAVASDSLKPLLVFNEEGVKGNRIYQQMLGREVLPW